MAKGSAGRGSGGGGSTAEEKKAEQKATLVKMKKEAKKARETNTKNAEKATTGKKTKGAELKEILARPVPNAKVTTVGGKKVQYDRDHMIKSFPKALKNAEAELKGKGGNQLQLTSLAKHWSKTSGIAEKSVKTAMANDKGLMPYLATKHNAKLNPSRSPDGMIPIAGGYSKQRFAYWNTG